MVYEPSEPTGYQKFLKSKAAPYVGLIVAAVVGLLFLYMNIYTVICGSFILGILLYMLPKALGANWKQMAVFGVIFLFVATAFGAFVITKPFIENQDGPHNDGNFKNASVDPYENGDVYTFYVEYEFPDGVIAGSKKIKLEYGKTDMPYMKLVPLKNPIEKKDMNSSGSGYKLELSGLDGGSVYYFRFIAEYEITGDDGIKEKKSREFLGPMTASDSDLTQSALMGNLYFVGLYVMLIFFLILIITTLMRSSLEKTREKLEAEGRLYPQGYGRCKNCGTVVLPGEVVCRKCGEYVDVPEQYKPKKVDYFVCSECGKEVPADANVCPACGEHFDEEETEIFDPEAETSTGFICSECGKQVPADAKTCPSCGKEFEDDE